MVGVAIQSLRERVPEVTSQMEAILFNLPGDPLVWCVNKMPFSCIDIPLSGL